MKYLAWLSVILLSVLSLNAKANLVIDSFTEDFGPAETFYYSNGDFSYQGLEIGTLSLNPGPSYVFRGSETRTDVLASVLGGVRTGTLTQVEGSPNNGKVSVSSGYNCLSLSSAYGIRGILEVSYMGNSGLNTNLASYGNKFAIDVTGDMYSGPRPLPTTITLTSHLGEANEVTKSVTQDLILDGVYNYAFSSFTGIDFTDVDVIKLKLDQTPTVTQAVDVAMVNGFLVVPEPFTIAGVIAGIGLLAARKRK